MGEVEVNQIFRRQISFEESVVLWERGIGVFDVVGEGCHRLTKIPRVSGSYLGDEERSTLLERQVQGSWGRRVWGLTC